MLIGDKYIEIYSLANIFCKVSHNIFKNINFIHLKITRNYHRDPTMELTCFFFDKERKKENSKRDIRSKVMTLVPRNEKSL